MEKKLLPRLAYNWTSTVVALLALISGFVIIFLLVITFSIGITNPYLGILLYLILPLFLAAGLMLIPIGMYVKWRAWQRTGVMPFFKWPLIDLNIKRHRNAAMIFIFGTLLLVLVSSVVVYQAYHFTDSVAFCGTTCHKVMKPEYTAYQNSPHARVACVNCHIGPGAGWYAKSKLRGLYQVYAVAADVYPRPIPTPIEELRPARETCEQCHWPALFLGYKQHRYDHYRYDKANTHWPIDMLIKTGGRIPGTTVSTGIHWHTDRFIRIDYIARDDKRQDIPWVKVIERHTGKVSIYQDRAKPMRGAEMQTASIRTMDCMDCHNRPSHNFHSPDYAIDNAILTGRIDRSLPDVKLVAVEAMAKDYRSDEEAEGGIARAFADYYRKTYPSLYLQKKRAVSNAAQATLAEFRKNIFPRMKARWANYPNNSGHFIFRGCMRCHDGNHKTADGATITNDCRACHIILAQGSGNSSEAVNLQTGLPFRHPVDIGDAWRDGSCYNCHSGVKP